MRRPAAVAATLLAAYVVLTVVGLLMYGATPPERIPAANDAAPRVDLPGVSAELHAAVRRTMAPDGVALWLRPGSGGTRAGA